jgi:hypothetical protein
MGITSPFTDGTLVNKAQLDVLVNAINANSNFYGQQTSSTAVTLSTNAAFAGSASVTVTLTEQRRIKVDVQAIFVMASGTNGRYLLYAGYNTGGSVTIGAVTGIGYALPQVIAATAQSSSGWGQCGTVLLAAGTYTFYPVVQRSSGGSATDTAVNHQIIVYDMGNV